ncbi:MAG: EutN/CcmL family microcompartment protein [Phycisphaeraceae bacterium]|nr:EutN/CcmL family microcompartment protein [Phycisphaeraceae bacterium]
MRIAKVIGCLTLSRKRSELRPGRYLIAEAFDADSLAGIKGNVRRKSAMPESLIVFDELGAGVGQIIAVSEGREACMPFHPTQVPIDAYNAAILDSVEVV